MDPVLTLQRIQKEYSMIIKEPVPNIITFPNPSNIFEWLFCFYGLKDCAYEGGCYFGKIQLAANYPIAPPKLIFITPNGRFKENMEICTSFSNYHPESWHVSWNISKMLLASISLFTSEEQTTGCVNMSAHQRALLAKYSVVNNLKN